MNFDDISYFSCDFIQVKVSIGLGQPKGAMGLKNYDTRLQRSERLFYAGSPFV
jgi:hypothetical protein